MKYQIGEVCFGLRKDDGSVRMIDPQPLGVLRSAMLQAALDGRDIGLGVVMIVLNPQRVISSRDVDWEK